MPHTGVLLSHPTCKLQVQRVMWSSRSATADGVPTRRALYSCPLTAHTGRASMRELVTFRSHISSSTPPMFRKGAPPRMSVVVMAGTTKGLFLLDPDGPVRGP